MDIQKIRTYSFWEDCALNSLMGVVLGNSLSVREKRRIIKWVEYKRQ